MDLDVTQIVAAIVQNEGGSYTVPFTAFDELADGGDEKALAVDPVEDGLKISLISAEDIPEGVFDE